METTLPHSSNVNSAKPTSSLSILGARLTSLDYLVIGAIAIILALQLHLQFVQKINWDEFFYLSHIYDAQNGRLDKLLQMGHVYLFGWLTHIPGGEMMQITVGRVAMWAAQLGTLLLIVATARKFMSLTSALFAALCFLGLGFVFIHGTNFRADPLAALCMMYGVYVFAASDLRHRDLIGLAIALALGAFVTIKVILFAPLLAVLAIWRLHGSENRQALFLKFSLTVIAVTSLFIVALLLHGMTLQSSENVASASSFSMTSKTAIFSGGFFPRLDIMKVGLVTGLLPSVFIVLGILTALWSVIKTKTKRNTALIMLAMALPFLSFVFYRNAYPYFYAFILPPVSLLAGYAVHRLNISNLILKVIGVMMVANIVFLYGGRIEGARAAQAQTLAAIHDIFPEPVNYFDRSGMIASFPKVGIFMSGWGLRSYQRRGEAVFAQNLNTNTVPLLIDNSPTISAVLRGEPSGLLPQDVSSLKDNYIPHWGHIWVAGKRLTVNPAPLEISIIIPGTYTVESNAAVVINGTEHGAGASLFLKRGSHEIRSQNLQNMTLRWGENLYRPSGSALKSPIFGSF